MNPHVTCWLNLDNKRKFFLFYLFDNLKIKNVNECSWD
jgi:hypothetical protein